MATTTINKNLIQTARDLGVSLGALLRANPQLSNPNLIRSGTKLNVPGRRRVSARENARQLARVFSSPQAGASSASTPAAAGPAAPAVTPGTAAFYSQGNLPIPRFTPGRPTAVPSVSRGLDLQIGRPAGSASEALRNRAAANANRGRGSSVAPTAGLGDNFITRGLVAAGNRRGEALPGSENVGSVVQTAAQAFRRLPLIAAYFGQQLLGDRNIPSSILPTPGSIQGSTGLLNQAAQTPTGQFAAGLAGKDFNRFASVVPSLATIENIPSFLSSLQDTARAPGNTLRPVAADSEEIFAYEFVRQPDGTMKRIPRTRAEMETRMSTPQEAVWSQSVNGKTYSLTPNDVAYAARMTGQALLNAAQKLDPNLRPNLVSNLSAYNLLGMGEMITGHPVESVEGMMTELGYTLVGDFWVRNDETSVFTSVSAGFGGSVSTGGGGTGRAGSGRGGGFGAQPRLGPFNWRVRITI